MDLDYRTTEDLAAADDAAHAAALDLLSEGNES